MIDRLEELLKRVEDPEREETAVQLTLVRPAVGNSAAGGRETVQAVGEEKASVAAEPEAALARMLAHGEGDSGLSELYRQMAQVTGTGNAAGRGSVAVIRETIPADTAGLTAGELDLAMRRDSRRYDGGMTIY